LGEWAVVGEGGKINGEGEGAGIRSMYFICLYEDITMKLIKIILSRGEGGEGE
jgi:hypothetical protein